MPQILVSMLLLLQGRGLSGDDARMQSQLGLFAAVVVLFWSLVGCGALTLRGGMRPVAGALAWGSAAGFVLTVVVAFVA